MEPAITAPPPPTTYADPGRVGVHDGSAAVVETARAGVVVIPRPSELHAHDKPPDVQPALLTSIGPVAVRRRTEQARRQSRLQLTLRRVGIVLVVLAASLAAGGLLAVTLSSIH